MFERDVDDAAADAAVGDRVSGYRLDETTAAERLISTQQAKQVDAVVSYVRRQRILYGESDLVERGSALGGRGRTGLLAGHRAAFHRRRRHPATRAGPRHGRPAGRRRGPRRRGETCPAGRADKNVFHAKRPDTMGLLGANLPAEQAAACYQALDQDARAKRANGDERSINHIMCDTLVERAQPAPPRLPSKACRARTRPSKATSLPPHALVL